MKFKFICCVFLSLSINAFNQTLKKKGSDTMQSDKTMVTRWAKDVSPEKVWPEYPRPQMVRSNWINLNGMWNYAIVAKDAGKPASWDGKILVPFAPESFLSGVQKPVLPAQSLWYQRVLIRPDMKTNERVLLHFGAVDWKCTVWLNGIEVGSHTGGFDPFSFDITDHIKTGNNELLVSVLDPTETGLQAVGKQSLNPSYISYTAVTGIWQTVWMETVPENYIQSIQIDPDVDRKVVRMTVETTSPSSLNIKVLYKEKVVNEIHSTSGKLIELGIPEPKLWSPDSPNLYDLKISLLGNKQSNDHVTGYFGMRKINVTPDADGIPRLMLNNKFIFQHGTLDQGYWPDGLYTPPTDDAIKYDIEMTKKFGMNMARKHVKVESARWYYWCDRMGLLVWQDMPANGANPRSDESRELYRIELKRMMDALHNFPSIIMWIPFNEGWGQFDTPEIVEWIKKYDPSRVVNEASGFYDKGSGDISDRHSSPSDGPLGDSKGNRAQVLGEWGALGRHIEGHIWQNDRSWTDKLHQSEIELTNTYVEQLEQIRLLNPLGLSGAVYIQTSDVEREVNGLMTYDRQLVKMDLKRSAEAAGRIYNPPVIKNLIPTSQGKAQTWQYTTTQPADNWFASDFDDNKWATGPGAFGGKDTPRLPVGTVWSSSDIWLRRTVNLDKIPSGADIRLLIYYDNDAELYINGILLKELKGNMNGYGVFAITSGDFKLFREGSNTLAVHCNQVKGDQGIDVGIILVEQKP